MPEKAQQSLRQLLPEDPNIETAIIVGSGLGKLADRFKTSTSINYDQLAGFPQSTAPGHRGCLHFATYQNMKLGIFDGRFHMYEGWSAQEAVAPIYLSRLLGAKQVIITNAVGALNPSFNPGEVMIVTDHLNFTGRSPLIGANDEAIGARFPDMSRAYSQALRTVAKNVFRDQSIDVNEGIYAGVLGPELETSAERRFLRLAGADAVGMSLVMETIAAVHSGMDVLALAAISNIATGMSDQPVDSIEAVLENAEIAGNKIALTLPTILEQLPAG